MLTSRIWLLSRVPRPTGPFTLIYPIRVRLAWTNRILVNTRRFGLLIEKSFHCSWKVIWEYHYVFKFKCHNSALSSKWIRRWWWRWRGEFYMFVFGWYLSHLIRCMVRITANSHKFYIQMTINNCLPICSHTAWPCFILQWPGRRLHKPDGLMRAHSNAKLGSKPWEKLPKLAENVSQTSNKRSIEVITIHQLYGPNCIDVKSHFG